MTEAQWLSCADPERMRKFVRPRLSDRKLRLLACAWCRACDLLDDAACTAVEESERYADGLATDEELRAARAVVQPRLKPVVGEEPVSRAVYEAAGKVTKTVSAAFWWLRAHPFARRNPSTIGDLIREIVGNPFRLVPFAPDWRTDTALALARQMYESRDFSAMPILADAFQDAGCDDILAHCRGDGPHVRGCWVVDLVLGKE
jgi:hypothetical protein